MKLDRQRVVLIGLDGATFDLLLPWMEQGELPTLKKLKDEGVAAPMTSIMPPISAPAWTSFFTGKNPGKHGIVDFFYRKDGSYEIVPVNSRDNKAETLFSILSRAGKKVVLVNIPVAYPPEQVNGILISGLQTPSESDDFTYPKELKEELDRVCGGYRINSGSLVSRGNIKKRLQTLYEVTEKQLKACTYLMRRKQWDFFMFVVQGTDQIQHIFWRFFDERHPLYVPGNDYKRAILDFYKRIDSYLAGLLAGLDKNTTLMIVSDHGAAPIYKLVNLNGWLVQEGYMTLKRNPRTVLKRMLYGLNVTPLSLYNAIIKSGLGGRKERITKSEAHRWIKKIFLTFDNVDWPKTKAYALGNGGEVYINLRGREPQGSVEAADYERVRRDIFDELTKMDDKSAGAYQLKNQVFLKEDIYRGPFLASMPDLVFWPEESWYNSIGAYEFPSNKVFELISHGPTATHTTEGIFMAYGCRISDGSKPARVDITDVTPTILNIMGIEVMDDFDGKVLSGIFKAGRKQADVRLPGVQREGEYFYNKEEAQKIKRNLENLGYIG